MGYIYKITNKVNGKVYIGQTRYSVERRFKEHLHTAFSKTEKKYAIHKAIIKYGAENFEVEVLEKCYNSRLNILEARWIRFYNSYGGGYNLTPGGTARYKRNLHKTLQELWDEGLTIKEISEQLGYWSGTVMKKLKILGVTSEEIQKRARAVASKKCIKKIYQYDIYGNYIRSFENREEAAKSVGAAIIVPSAKGTNHTYMGYQWRTFKADKIESVADRYHSVRSVHQYTLDGDYIATYPNACAAARAVGETNGSSIISTCNKTQLDAFGYRWSFEKMNKLPPRKRKDKKPVIGISKINGVPKVYASIADAARDNNVHVSTISKVIGVPNKTAGGRYWNLYDAV